MSDHLGTPLELVDEGGGVVWGAQLDSYGRIRQGTGKASLCPFRYQGQYEDAETGLYYNRFRYYAPQEGMYISQDPIRMMGDKSTLYGYVGDINVEIDELGLQGGGSYSRTRKANVGGETNHVPAWNSIERAKQINPNLPNTPTHGSTPATHMDTPDHRRMTSTGSSRAARRWRQQQADLIARNKFGKAMEMDIREIRRRYGNTYNTHVREMLDYAHNQNLITGAERNRLARKLCRG